MIDEKTLNRHHLILFFTRTALLVIAAGTLLRPLLVELPTVYTYIGILNLVILSAIYLGLRANLLPGWEVSILMAAGFATVIPLTLISGGVNSQFTYILPTFPVVAALTGSRRITVITASLAILLVLGMTLFGGHLWDLTGEQMNQGKSLSRSFWLVISLVAVTYFSLHYQHNNATLTRRLDAQATQDHLTGLLNRRGLQNSLSITLEQADAKAEPLSLLLMDIDHFKRFNDDYGHAAGDACLIEVAACLKKGIRSADTAARFGGEEFVVMLPNTDQHRALVVAESLRKQIFSLQLQDIPLPISVTIGLASHIPGSESTQADLLQRADKALYEGKNTGRNCVKVA